MAELTDLERTALEAVLAELGEGRSEIAGQLLGASVLSRENSGGGFFTALELRSEIPPHFRNRQLGRNAWISVEGMSHGLGMILHLREAEVPLLEGYAVAPENTSSIDFEQVRFARVQEPAPFPSDLP